MWLISLIQYPVFRQEPKSKKRGEDDYKDRRNKDRNRSQHRNDDYDDRDNRRRSKHRDDGYESDSDNRNRRNRSKRRDSYDDTDDFNDESDNRRRRPKPKYRDSDNDDDDYVQENIRDRGQKGRTRSDEKAEKSRNNNSREKQKDRKVGRDRDPRTLDIDDKNTSGDKLDDVEVSPRDKIGLPNDLSWRHMTKAEKLRLAQARQRFLDEEER